VLQGDETRKPSVAELLGASEAVLLTSIQEGFGLPYLEAAAANRPLIARIIPNIAPDLGEFGFKFPQSYREILIAPSLFDYVAERRRQEILYRKWRQALPRAVRVIAQRPALLAAQNAPRPVPFSRLTLTAQFEVLTHAAEKSWLASCSFNPFLSDWRERAGAERLHLTRWPQTADQWLSGQSYARRFRRIVFSDAETLVSPQAAIRVQRDFLRENVRTDRLFPLLWET
jgi:hypothetical protein